MDDPNGPGIRACVGDAGNGALINTSKPGGHTFTVTAVSNDGGIASDTVFYMVAPSNRFQIETRRVHRGGSIDLTLTVPGRGRIDVFESVSSGRIVFARRTGRTTHAGRLHLTIRPSARGRRVMRRRREVRVSVLVA